MSNKQFVIIEWNDCAMYGVEQLSEKEAEECHLVRMISSGFLVKEDKQKIILAQDWHPDDKQYRKVTVYPKSGIVHTTKKYFFEKIKKKNENSI